MMARGFFENQGLPKGGDEFVEAFAKGLVVIRVFAEQADALTLSEVADRAGIPPASARRLLYTLVHMGYARVEGRRFRLTPRILDLGFSYLSSLSLREQARPLIDAFARETGEVCTLSVLEGTDVVYIARAEIRSPLTRMIGLGERLPAHATSSGHVLLAGAATETVEGFLSQAPFPSLTPKTLCTRKELSDAIEIARQQGWAMAIEQLELGVCGLAVPVLDSGNSAVAALTISVNLARYTPEAIQKTFLRKLQQIADELRPG